MGTSCDQSPYTRLPPNAKLVIDLSVKQGQLKSLCQASDVKYLSGREFYKYQFKVQFQIYTGIEINDQIYDKYDNAFFG
jgi:shikimate 5-dehydrogenase